MLESSLVGSGAPVPTSEPEKPRSSKEHEIGYVDITRGVTRIVEVQKQYVIHWKLEYRG